jgi:uncharacterized iron-regulated protein
MNRRTGNMKKFVLFIILGLSATIGWSQSNDQAQTVFDLSRKMSLPLAQAAQAQPTDSIVLVGEHHSNRAHHWAQLRVVQALKASGANVAIGLEMFRKDSQAMLNRWVAGETDRKEFEAVYYDNWNFPWDAYSMIFEYARENKMPMIGLNVSRDITRQVAMNGFQSLSEEQKGKMADVTCQVDEAYMSYIRDAYGSHAHGEMNFTFFCEAQLVWDTAMAVHALDYLQSNPGSVVVLLTGVGHAQNGAIPRQIRQRSNIPVTVFLPEVPGSIDAETVDSTDADYLLLKLE